MTYKTRFAIMIAILFWASAFVGIRAGLQYYSPEGLALLRYIIASACMAIFYLRLPSRNPMSLKDACGLLIVGAIGIGIYNIALNYSELFINSGTASFIIGQSPIITALFALLFLGERVTKLRLLGFMVSVLGVACIAIGQSSEMKWELGLGYVLLAATVGGLYSVMQKPFLKKYNAIEATTFIMWGGTLFLLMYFPKMQHDLAIAPFSSTLIVAYLGIFPAAVGYIAWGYALATIPASRAVSYLYFMPFLAMMLGWVWLHEVPVYLTIVGGLLAVSGVWIVNHSYRQPTSKIV